MAGFYYWFPESTPITRGSHLNEEILRQCQLDYSLHDCTEQINECVVRESEGPGGAGTLVYPKPTHGKDPATLYGYKPESQQWLDRGGFYIGWETDAPPQPDDLSRQEINLGYAYERDGMRWHIPIVRSHDETPSLPADYVFTSAGEMQAVPKQQFRSHWDLAGDAFEYLETHSDNMSDEERHERWPEEKLVRMALTFLGLNYRIGIHEVTALSQCGNPILDQSSVSFILHAATDWPRYVEYKKKAHHLRNSKPSMVSAEKKHGE